VRPAQDRSARSTILVTGATGNIDNAVLRFVDGRPVGALTTQFLA